MNDLVVRQPAQILRSPSRRHYSCVGKVVGLRDLVMLILPRDFLPQQRRPPMSLWWMAVMKCDGSCNGGVFNCGYRAFIREWEGGLSAEALGYSPVRQNESEGVRQVE